jgi:prophage regulatory protein
MSKRILRRAAVQDRTGETRSTIYAKMARGEFPKPVKLGEKAVGWVESEIDAYIDSKITARDGADA